MIDVSCYPKFGIVMDITLILYIYKVHVFELVNKCIVYNYITNDNIY